MADWDEIKRLAADFQRAQTSDTLQRLSDRNCIDIVKKLTELNLIELIYTCDGKEFITPKHLIKEIEDEIYVNGGRMHLHDLASNLNVDYQHIENKAQELAVEKPDEYSLILGQIIHSTYKVTLGKQINDCMLTTGQLSIADFAKSLDLPSEFLLSIVKDILPRLSINYVQSQDGRTFYTTDMMDRYKSIIAGTLSAVTRPTTIASIMKRLDIPDRIFMPIIEGFTKDGRLDASIENRVFIPAVHARKQNDWIDKFYSSNSYIDYDVLTRMDIKQPKAFLKKRFPDGIQLKTCFISPNLSSQVESLIEESISSSSCIDISTAVSSTMESDDIELLVQDILKRNKQFSSSCLLFNRTNVCSLGYVATCKETLNRLMPNKAQEHLKSGKLINHFLGGKLKEPSNESDVKQNQLESTVEEKNVIDKAEDAAKEDVEEQQLNSGDPVTRSKEGKREHKDKKNKLELDRDDLDEDLSRQKPKVKRSGGAQGREIKQKAVKKKYIPGNKGNLKGNDDSDEEFTLSKVSRSNKGRAARRAISPERPTTISKSTTKSQPIKLQPKEPLIFMTKDEIISKIKSGNRGSEEFSEEVYDSIAQMIQSDLDTAYKAIAKQTLDDYLKSREEEECNAGNTKEVEDVDIVE